MVLLGVFLEEFSKLCLVYFSNSQLGGGFKYMFSRLLESEKNLSVLGA